MGIVLREPFGTTPLAGLFEMHKFGIEKPVDANT